MRYSAFHYLFSYSEYCIILLDLKKINEILYMYDIQFRVIFHFYFKKCYVACSVACYLAQLKRFRDIWLNKYRRYREKKKTYELN